MATRYSSAAGDDGWPASDGRTPGWCSPPTAVPRWTPGTAEDVQAVCAEAGIGDGWTPRELRTSVVSLLSHRGVSIEEIPRLVGHASTRTTEIVYRRELRPVITTGAEIMDQRFTEPNPRADPTAAEDLHKPFISRMVASGFMAVPFRAMTSLSCWSFTFTADIRGHYGAWVWPASMPADTRHSRAAFSGSRA